MAHGIHDLADTVRLSEDDLDHARSSHRRIQRLLVGSGLNPGPLPQEIGRWQEPEEVPVPLEWVGKVVDDYPWVVRFQKGRKIERAVLDLGQQRRGRRQTLAIEGLAEGVHELRTGIEDRHGRPCHQLGHVDLPFSLRLRRSLRDRAVAASPAGASTNDSGTTRGAACGGPSRERGGAPHGTLRRAVAMLRTGAPFEDPAPEARHQLVTDARVDPTREGVNIYNLQQS